MLCLKQSFNLCPSLTSSSAWWTKCNLWTNRVQKTRRKEKIWPSLSFTVARRNKRKKIKKRRKKSRKKLILQRIPTLNQSHPRSESPLHLHLVHQNEWGNVSFVRDQILHPYIRMFGYGWLKYNKNTWWELVWFQCVVYLVWGEGGKGKRQPFEAGETWNHFGTWDGPTGWE